MSNYQLYASGFKLYYEKLLISCDSQEETASWPVEELGDLETWLVNDLSCLILRLIASDGIIREEEVSYLNEAMGFQYSVETLKEVYDECGDQIDTYLEKALPESICMLERLSPPFADDYREMLGMLARIVIECDDDVRPEEKASAEELLNAVRVPQ